MMKVRKFNEEGILQMGKYLDSLTTDDPLPYPVDILTDSSYIDVVIPEIEIEQRKFSNRFEVGEYFNEKFSGSTIENIERDRGLWSWLAHFYFEEICDVDSEGNKKPGERARWIPDIWNHRKYYRHLLAGPYRIYRTYRNNPKRAYALLCTPPNKPGEVVEQLSSRQELVTNPSIMEAATRLYVNQSKGIHKIGAAGKGPGSARRLADIIFQFDLTWDLYSMTSEEIINMLPMEFERYIDN